MMQAQTVACRNQGKLVLISRLGHDRQRLEEPPKLMERAYRDRRLRVLADLLHHLLGKPAQHHLAHLLVEPPNSKRVRGGDSSNEPLAVLGGEALALVKIWRESFDSAAKVLDCRAHRLRVERVRALKNVELVAVDHRLHALVKAPGTLQQQWRLGWLHKHARVRNRLQARPDVSKQFVPMKPQLARIRVSFEVEVLVNRENINPKQSAAGALPSRKLSFTVKFLKS
mmetsp:Transcript_11320/g.36152  ORF Transcript_11320/g.36152 Transcript_11320/m.36152 type:complete len:227 (+) Transcript_11320:474-1154(+)